MRPTGLLDPPIEVRPTHDQVDNLLEEIRKRAEIDERVLVTTLTKRMAEELDDFFGKRGVRCRYIHSDVDTAERVEIIEDFKNGLFDVLIGVNLLREGLDIPTVSLVAILDADKEGFLRSQVALTQTAGRAARNVHGLVIMYADSITRSMQETIYETDRRRAKQIEYNKLHRITPKQVEVKHNTLISELGGSAQEGKQLGRVTASNSYDSPTFIPNPSALGKGRITVGLGDDSKRDSNSAYTDGYIRADLAAVLQDPVIRSMSRSQVEKAAEESRRKMKKRQPTSTTRQPHVIVTRCGLSKNISRSGNRVSHDISHRPCGLQIKSARNRVNVKHLPGKIEPRMLARFQSFRVDLGQRHASACNELALEAVPAGYRIEVRSQCVRQPVQAFS